MRKYTSRRSQPQSMQEPGSNGANRSAPKTKGAPFPMRPSLVLRWRFELEAAGRSLESMHRLLGGPGHHPQGVIAVAENVIAGRKTMLGAFDFHLVQLFDFELVIPDHAPIVRRRIHGEAGRQRAIRPDDQRVLTGATLPGWHLTAH